MVTFGTICYCYLLFFVPVVILVVYNVSVGRLLSQTRKTEAVIRRGLVP